MGVGRNPSMAVYGFPPIIKKQLNKIQFLEEQSMGLFDPHGKQKTPWLSRQCWSKKRRESQCYTHTGNVHRLSSTCGEEKEERLVDQQWDKKRALWAAANIITQGTIVAGGVFMGKALTIALRYGTWRLSYGVFSNKCTKQIYTCRRNRLRVLIRYNGRDERAPSLLVSCSCARARAKPIDDRVLIPTLPGHDGVGLTAPSVAGSGLHMITNGRSRPS